MRFIETLDQALYAVVRGEVVHFRLWTSRFRPVVNDCLAHGQSLPFGPVNFVITPLADGSPVHVFRGLRDHLLREIHNALVIGVSLVCLEHGELGIPAPAEPLVPEVAVDLIHAIQPADDQPLQIKFGCDAEVEIHIERVVMRDKRPRHSSTGDGLHHRSLDFDESAGIERAPHRLHQLVPPQENFAHFRIHHQIDVALAVAQFDVGEAVPLFRQGKKILAQERDFLDVNG